MEKWADYVIVGVRYDADHSQIDSVRRCPDLGDKLGKANIVTRAEIVASIRSGATHVTAYRNDDDPDTWRKGDVVGIIAETDFIRTDGDKTKEDNLGKLPKF